MMQRRAGRPLVRLPLFSLRAARKPKLRAEVRLTRAYRAAVELPPRLAAALAGYDYVTPPIWC